MFHLKQVSPPLNAKNGFLQTSTKQVHKVGQVTGCVLEFLLILLKKSETFH